ncbi:sialate O-acetylesterase [Cyclobacterium xiamenense]|uniref:sialate O-acetylesterase n=1 Tax=Cyclobacterium xiamenense TaxID=1297121 RepID=UPI0035CF80EF
MRLSIKLLLLIFATCQPVGLLSAQPAPEKDLDIYLAIGQSNMAGRAVVPPDLSAPLDGVFLFTGENWVAARNPLNIYSSIRKDSGMQRLSPSYGFARKMATLQKSKNLGLVVNAKGGSAIEEWMPGTPFFEDMLLRVRQATKDGTLRGVIWHQGESNAGKPEVYLNQLGHFITALRDSLSMPHLPFVAGQLSVDKELRKPFNEQLLQLPERVPHTAVVLSYGTATFDSTHFDSPSQVLLGERYAEKMNLLLQENQHQQSFTFGLIADVQYADAATAGKRNYRGTLKTLERTIPFLNAFEPEFVLTLGDLIDRDFESFDAPLGILEGVHAPLHHVWGNHDFSVADNLKAKVGEKLGNSTGYYSFERGNLVFLVVNGMDISLEGHPEGSENYQKASDWMARLESSGANNAKPWNGGIGEEQLAWLVSKVSEAENSGKKVLVFCHYPLLPENGLHLLNSREVLSKIGRSPALVAWFSGHHHEGNYVQDAQGLHHLTLRGMVEAQSPVLGAAVRVYPDKMVIHGIGDEMDRVLEFR